MAASYPTSTKSFTTKLDGPSETIFAAWRDLGLEDGPPVHAGAGHGYALPDRDIHDHAASEVDWREIFAMFERQLGGR